MKRIVILGIVILVVVAGYSGVWLYMAGQITTYAKSLETADGVTTPKLTCGSFGVGGYPFAFDLTCTSVTVTLGDTTATLSGLKATAEVYAPTHVLVFAQSPVTVADAFTGSQSRLDFTAANASARLDGWRIGRVSVVVDAPVWNDTVLEDRLIAKASKLEMHLVDVPDQHDAAKGLATLAQYAEVDDLVAPGFDIAAGKSTLESAITNLPDDVRTYGDVDLLQRWQAAGGQFKLTGFKGNDGERFFDASGNLNLDAQGRVGGQIKLISKGVVEHLGTTIPEQFKGLVLGAQAADGSYNQTLNIAAGVVFAGLVPAAMIPQVFAPSPSG